MHSQTRAYCYAVAAVLCWSTVASAFKLTLREIGVLDLLFVSSLTSFLALAIIAGLQGNMRQLSKWNRQEWLGSALLGLLNPFLYYLVLFRAYDLLPAQEAQPLNQVWPLVLALLSVVLLRQRIGWRSFAAMFVSFLGVVIIATRGAAQGLQFTNTEGVGLAVGSSLIWALYWILNMRSRADRVLKLMTNFLFGSVYIGILYAAIGDPGRLNLAGIGGAVYVGLFEMGLTFVFWLNALTLSSTTARVGHLVYLSPFLSLLVIHGVVGETIMPSTVIGLVLIIGGILLQRLTDRAG